MRHARARRAASSRLTDARARSNPIYFSPAAGNASFTLEIGANGAGIQKLTSGSRIAIVCAWEGVALTQGQIEAFRQATRPSFGV